MVEHAVILIAANGQVYELKLKFFERWKKLGMNI